VIEYDFGMKKRITLVIFLNLPALLGFSQTYVGARSGYNMSIINFKPWQDTKMVYRMGGDYGITVKHFDNDYVGFQAELNYVERGYRQPYGEWEIFMHLNHYIELPMFLQGRFMYKGYFVHLNAGCYGAYLLWAEEGLNTTGEFDLKPYKINILYDERFDFGLVGGFGLGKEFKWGTLQADARLFYGFADLFDHDYEEMPEESRSTVESVSVSYYLNLSKLREQLTERKGRKTEIDNQ